jgi:hypothetical protein
VLLCATTLVQLDLEYSISSIHEHNLSQHVAALESNGLLYRGSSSWYHLLDGFMLAGQNVDHFQESEDIVFLVSLVSTHIKPGPFH